MDTETREPGGEFGFSPQEAPPLGRLRQWVRSRLADACPDLLCDVELVITELVSNAYDHAGGLLAVRLSRRPDGAVRVEVDDAAPAGVLRLGASTLGEARGRGLVMVDNLSRTWGVWRRGDRKVVWATVRAA
ncbi:ATP-binding protein [Saccharothrix longispora]|uniref:ATP-binding protein n=1 Tax=Saccharothrix longispora TaxID=33920 RepID=UPI0028FD4605|nr:ATP-binding protein [Saccharothrix longispora]MBY8850063.1 ATP-binding protein [Saccharothrix sp. MB29]MDU0287614.1 ATP-binding protein [Saccharothrix longispora]